MTRQVRKPRNINYTLSAELVSRLSALDITAPAGVDIYVTDSNRGQFRTRSLTVTIPIWSYNHTATKCNDDPEHAIYYAAHELAHAWVHANGQSRNVPGGDDSMHGVKFYKEFKRLCPPHLWHYELEYKPRDAKRAGILPTAKENSIAALPNAPAAVRDTVDRMVTARPVQQDNAAYDDYVNANPKLERALNARAIPDRERNSFIRGWAKLDQRN